MSGVNVNGNVPGVPSSGVLSCENVGMSGGFIDVEYGVAKGSEGPIWDIQFPVSRSGVGLKSVVVLS